MQKMVKHFISSSVSTHISIIVLTLNVLKPFYIHVQKCFHHSLNRLKITNILLTNVHLLNNTEIKNP